MTDYPDQEYVKAVCKVGQGELCCRYVTMGMNGWSCEKHSDLKYAIDRRVASGDFTAKGNNCEGKDAR